MFIPTQKGDFDVVFVEQLAVLGGIFQLQVLVENFLDVILTCSGYVKSSTDIWLHVE